MQTQKPENSPFLYTDSKDTADELLKIGYPLLSSTETSYTFLNTNLKNFSHDEMKVKSLVYSNRICLEGR